MTLRRGRPARLGPLTVALIAAGLALAACGQQSANAPTPTASSSPSLARPGNGGDGPISTAIPAAPILQSSYSKVMIIAEENEAESAIIGSSQAPYISRLASTYGQATNMVANYPVDCPSLAAYIIMTSGDRQGICDDKLPENHQLLSDNIFQQVAVAGKQWRQYAESMTGNCQRTNSANGVYLVRHAPPPYYASEATRCASWDVPMGTITSGPLRSAITAGLPDYSFVTPNACNDMHGAPSCRTSLIKHGDDWLAKWMPLIMAGPDYRAGRLAVLITWDEGSRTSNHIATVLVAPTVRGVKSSAAYTHCSTLRLAEDMIGLPRIACAATAASFRAGFGF